MNLNERERRLLFALGAVILLMAVYFLFFRGGDGDDVVVPELFPSTAPTAVSPPDGAGPSGSPSFVVPPGARDPFKA